VSVFISFPKVGLGNMLFVWARAYVFSQKNDLELITPSWTLFHFGAWYRGETKKRLYMRYFKATPFYKRWFYAFLSFGKKKVNNPSIDTPVQLSHSYKFSKPLVSNDVFEGMRNHSHLIRKGIEEMLHHSIRKQLMIHRIPEISIHVRRGDFKINNPVTPEAFFVDTIRCIREITAHELSVSVFTDGKDEEVEKILALANTHLVKTGADIIDILLMSKSQFLVLSQSSSFSYWSAFLSDAILFKPHNDWQKFIREENDPFELKWNTMNDHRCDDLKKALSQKNNA
jgi:hypothetical protein